MLRAGCEQRFIDVANWILGATRNAKGLGINTAREEGVQPLEKQKTKRKGNKEDSFVQVPPGLLLFYLKNKNWCAVYLLSVSQ